MVIHKTEGTGESRIHMRRGLGEWVRPERDSDIPDRPKATPVRHNEPEGALALMMPERGPLLSTRNAVQFATSPPAGA
jgi:hypothetical protein